MNLSLCLSCVYFFTCILLLFDYMQPALEGLPPFTITLYPCSVLHFADIHMLSECLANEGGSNEGGSNEGGSNEGVFMIVCRVNV